MFAAAPVKVEVGGDVQLATAGETTANEAGDVNVWNDAVESVGATVHVEALVELAGRRVASAGVANVVEPLGTRTAGVVRPMLVELAGTSVSNVRALAAELTAGRSVLGAGTATVGVMMAVVIGMVGVGVELATSDHVDHSDH